MASSSSSSAAARFLSCFNHWLAQQESDLNELLQALDTNASDTLLTALVARIISNFQDYATRRRALTPENPAAFFTPSWCSSFENSFLWLGGCRPSLAVRLVYSQSSSDTLANLDQILAGTLDVVASGGMLGLDSEQMDLLQDLHGRTVEDEDRMSSKMAQLQKDMAGNPLLPIVRERPMVGSNNIISMAMEQYMQKLARLMEEADELRIRTLRQIVMEILTPRQAAELLAVGKQLHLAVHAWGQNRDREIMPA